MNYLKEAKNIEEDIIKWRRDLHQIPELGLELPNTSKYVQNQLDKMGIAYKTMVNGSGIVALIGEGGKVIALRADMDGLPIIEDTGLEFASTNGNMHACGHDSHTAMLLGAAKILKENEASLNGRVKFIFQPGEEGYAGAKEMIKEGVLENPKVDTILGLHIGTPKDGIDDGKVLVNYGKTMTCLDKFTMKINGVGSHGAYPDTGVDPIVISAQIINALQTVVSREKNGTDAAVVTVGMINGGSAFNIIPDFIELEGTARFADNDLREKSARRIGELSTGIASAMRGSVDYDYHFGYPPLVNSKEAMEEFVVSAKNLLGEEEIVELSQPIMGGEDMAYYLEQVPGAFFFLASSVYDENGKFIASHNPKFDVQEGVLHRGSALFVQRVMDFLNS